MGAENYFEFSGNLIKAQLGTNGHNGYVWIEGLTPRGYTTSITFDCSDRIVNEINEKAKKNDWITICGHLELLTRVTDTLKKRKKIILCVDRLTDVTKDKGYEMDEDSD